MGGKIMPSAVLVIQNGTTKLVNIKNQDGVTKILDMVPDFVNKFAPRVVELCIFNFKKINAVLISLI